MIRARGDETDAGSERSDQGRTAPVDAGAIAKLAERVESPRDHRAIAPQRERVRLAGRDRYDAGEPWHRCRRAARGERAVTELPEVVAAPRAHGAVGMQRQRVPAAGGDG